MATYLKAILDKSGEFSEAVKLQSRTYYDDNKMQVGLGVNLVKIGNNKLIVKTGDTMGQSSVLGYDLENNWGVIIFINQRNGKIRAELFNELYEILSK